MKMSNGNNGPAGNTTPSASEKFNDRNGGANNGWVSRAINGAKRAFSAAKDVVVGGSTKN